MASQLHLSGYLLGLDVGEKRIGAALISVIARLPRPIDVIDAQDEPHKAIKRIIDTENVSAVIVGLPRNLNGEETAQSQSIRDFAVDLMADLEIPVFFADESLSSQRADELMKQGTFKGASRDSLAACFILEEFFRTIGNDTEELHDV